MLNTLQLRQVAGGLMALLERMRARGVSAEHLEEMDEAVAQLARAAGARPSRRATAILFCWPLLAMLLCLLAIRSGVAAFVVVFLVTGCIDRFLADRLLSPDLHSIEGDQC